MHLHAYMHTNTCACTNKHKHTGVRKQIAMSEAYFILSRKESSVKLEALGTKTRLNKDACTCQAALQT